MFFFWGSLLDCLELCLNFSKSKLYLMQHDFPMTIFGYSGYVSILATWQTPWDTTVGSFLVAHSICYSPSDHVLFSQGQLLCQQTCTALPFLLCNSEWHIECFHSLAYIFCFFHLSFSALHQLQRLSQLQQSLLPLWFCFPQMVVTTDSIPSCWAFYF